MKKLFVALLAVFVLSSVAVMAIACGGEDEATTTTITAEVTTTVASEVTTTAVVDDAWTTEEAADHIGETGTIIGAVLAIQDMGEEAARYLIRLDSDQDGEGANAAVSYVNVGNFIDSGFGASMVGATVKITGEVYESETEAKPEIELITGDQIEILE